MSTRPQGYHLSYNEEQLQQIMLLRSQGVSIRKIAGMMGLARSVVGRAVRPSAPVDDMTGQPSNKERK